MTPDSVSKVLRELLKSGSYFGNLQVNIQGSNIVHINLNQSIKAGDNLKVVEISNT